MKINLNQLTIKNKGKVASFSNRKAFYSSLFWSRAVDPKSYRAQDVSYDLHKKACIKRGWSVC